MILLIHIDDYSLLEMLFLLIYHNISLNNNVFYLYNIDMV